MRPSRRAVAGDMHEFDHRRCRRHEGEPRRFSPRHPRLARSQLPAPRCASRRKSEADICWGGKRFKFQSDAQRLWLQRMGERGWTVPSWPREYGGGGLTHAQAAILREEMTALKCRAPLQSFGIWMLGPALLKYGSEAAEARGPAGHRARRDPLVPGLFGAQCRLRPGIAGHTRRDPRRPLRRQRPEGLDLAMPTRPTGSSAWCAPTPRRSTPASASC